MLDPYYLAHCSDEIEYLFTELETSILEDIARRIYENKYEMTSTARYQLNRAKALGMHDSEIKKQITEILKISEQRVSEIISNAAYEAVESDNLIFKEAYDRKLINTSRYDKASLSKLILKGVNATNGEIRNICKTTAKTARKLLISSLDQTYLGIQSGAFSQQEAVGFAVDRVAKTGLQWIDYQSGTHRRPDSVIRNVIRSGVNQTACKCQEKNFDDMGGNLVITTSHMGARPSHAEWQGKVFWWKKKYKNYQNFEQATGYGTGAGLGGWNCRHSFYPYFEGISNKTFEHYGISENQEHYELDQQQRYNERKIREWKRRQAVNKAGGVDNTREARKVREWQKRQADFLKAHPDMKRNYAREMIEKRTITIKETTVRKNNKLLKGYETALKKGDISSFVSFDTYRSIAENIEKQLVGLKAKGGIIISGYKTHFIDRIIGQYESSNEPVKGMRKGVSIEEAKEALLSGVVKDMPLRGNGKPSRRYITDTCFVTLNPNTRELIQVTPKR
ncbi:hypothetical protein HMPREF0863_00280 [Erysipelotrichaceae bacterium 5_2_54FAA]|nr:hypothetical protein HMPREF0863_00280 [Erysipelotrichaceae bacterium 5_2_54FAA]